MSARGAGYAAMIAGALLVPRLGRAADGMASGELRRSQLLKETGYVVLDIRTQEEFSQGHIQGAMNLPAAQLAGTNLPREARVVVYCSAASCTESRKAAEAFEAAGHKNVGYLNGGFAEWLARGYPVEKGGAVSTKRRAARVRPADARKGLEDGRFEALDVRPADEFQAGHLPGARNVPLEEMGTAVGWLSKDRTFLVYDRLSDRSRKAVEQLKEAGFEAVELAGGIAGWVKKKQPLEVK